jgi:hypothetical protein
LFQVVESSLAREAPPPPYANFEDLIEFHVCELHNLPANAMLKVAFQLLSPVIVEAMLDLSASGQIVFANPLPAARKFEVFLRTENRDALELLSRRKGFQLYEYGEPYRLAFSLSPPHIAQFQATMWLIDEPTIMEWWSNCAATGSSTWKSIGRL